MFAFFRDLKTEIANAPPFQFSPSSVAVSRHELKVISFWSAIIAFILLLPYLYAYLFTPATLYFLGGLGYVPDHCMHLAWSYQVAHGAFLGKNLFTSIPHEGAMFNLYLFAVGILSRITGLSLDTSYQIGRFFISWALGVSVYYFVALFFTGKERVWGWLAAMFAEGFSWMLPLLKQWYNLQIPTAMFPWISLDLRRHETYVFSSMLYFPLFCAALTFLFLTLRWSYISIASNSYRMALMAGSSLFLVSFVHPFDVIVIVTILCASVTLLAICYPRQWKQWVINLTIICLLGAPSILYNYWILNSNLGFSMWESQNICVSTSLISYFVGLGIPCLISLLWLLRMYNVKTILFSILIILVIGIFTHLYFIPTPPRKYLIFLPIFLFWHLQHFKKNKAEFSRFLLISTWILLFPVLVYSPFTFQSRLSIGLSVPFAVLSIAYIRLYIVRYNIASKTQIFIYAACLTISSIDSIYHYIYTWKITTRHYDEKTVIQSFPFWEVCPTTFIKKEELDAISIIEKGPNTGSVLCSYNTSHLIPRYTGKQVVGGSFAQTENYVQTSEEVKQFYSGAMSTTERWAFLQEKHVAYIFYGPDEQELDRDHSLPEWLEKNHWRPIHHPTEKTYGIYVKEGAPAEYR
jgi:hypothetical protein